MLKSTHPLLNEGSELLEVAAIPVDGPMATAADLERDGVLLNLVPK
jgi:hypothetical protein